MSLQFRRLYLLFLAGIIGSAPLLATTIQKMDLPELVKTSDNIVQGRVESVEARYEERTVVTYISVSVDDPLKGDRRRAVLVRQPGGKIGSMTVFIPGMPKYNVGDQVIVFLKNRQNGTFDIVGLGQGKYDIVNDSAVANVSGVSVMDPKTGVMSDAGFVEKAPLEAFKAQIRGLVK